MKLAIGYRWLICLCLTILLCLMADRAHAEEAYDHGHGPEPFGLDWSRGWFEPAIHSHLNVRQTPYIHPFTTEPAFTRRDLVLHYNYRDVTEQDEHNIEAELEWAFTRRLGIIVEVPYTFVVPHEGASINGLANVAVSPRVLLVEYDRFLLAGNLEIEIPTTDPDRGLAENEAALAPSLSLWADLGHWWTLNNQSGVEYTTESRESELFIRTSVIHTLGTPARNVGHTEQDHMRHGLPPGFLSFIFETDMATGLSGDEHGKWSAEGLFGLNYGLRENMDLRAAYVFPLSQSQALNNGITCGLIHHF
ncbi:MAG: hypothetical protein GY809_06640 [Planctomycetes bacterium]|nr:hypothetical protein [Planctomycetota bacterium]